MPEISIIVPVYKTEKYIHRCVDSILAQTFTDFELILVDDGSPDNCGAICDEYASQDERVQVIHQENQGQAAARNLALDWVFENSNSRFLSFIDSDDWAHPRFLELLLEGVRQYDVNICQCGHFETDGVMDFAEVSGSFSCVTPEEQFIEHYSAFMWDKLFARSCWEDIRFPEGQIYEDVAVWYRMLFRESKLALVSDALYFYYVNPDSTVRKNWTPAKLAQIYAWEDQIGYFEEIENRELLESAAIHFFQVTFGQLQLIKSTETISENEKRKYQKLLRRKLQHVLLRFHKVSFFREQDLWVYDIIYPKASWLYWTIKGIRRKLFTKITRE